MKAVLKELRITLSHAPLTQLGESSSLPGACVWRIDDCDANTWAGGCGALWTLTDGTPRENGMNYCHQCGRVLVQADEEEG